MRSDFVGCFKETVGQFGTPLVLQGSNNQEERLFQAQASSTFSHSGTAVDRFPALWFSSRLLAQERITPSMQGNPMHVYLAVSQPVFRGTYCQVYTLSDKLWVNTICCTKNEEAWNHWSSLALRPSLYHSLKKAGGPRAPNHQTSLHSIPYKHIQMQTSKILSESIMIIIIKHILFLFIYQIIPKPFQMKLTT